MQRDKILGFDLIAASPRPIQHLFFAMFISPTGARTLNYTLFISAMRVGSVVYNLIDGNLLPNSARP